MRLSPEERAERRNSFRQMSPAQKLDHVFSYYKIEIALVLIAAIVLGDVAYRQLTKKEVLLYSAYINISVGDDLDSVLGAGFVDYAGVPRKRNEVYIYHDLYLSRDPDAENHQYAYASRLKLLASIQAQKLDIVLMNREAYDLLSQSGYLYAIPDVLAQNDPVYSLIEPNLTENTVILEDNAIEYDLNEADVYEAVTVQAVNGIDVSSFPVFQRAGFSDKVYMGVIGNSPRLSAVFQYIEYLAAA